MGDKQRKKFSRNYFSKADREKLLEVSNTVELTRRDAPVVRGSFLSASQATLPRKGSSEPTARDDGNDCMDDENTNNDGTDFGNDDDQPSLPQEDNQQDPDGSSSDNQDSESDFLILIVKTTQT
jgi:hypothetical protein